MGSLYLRSNHVRTLLWSSCNIDPSESYSQNIEINITLTCSFQGHITTAARDNRVSGTYITFGYVGSITYWFTLCMRLGVSSVFLALNDQLNIRLTRAPLIGSCYTASSFALTWLVMGSTHLSSYLPFQTPDTSMMPHPTTLYLPSNISNKPRVILSVTVYVSPMSWISSFAPLDISDRPRTSTWSRLWILSTPYPNDARWLCARLRPHLQI